MFHSKLFVISFVLSIALISVAHADVKKNDEFIIRWLPDGSVISFFQGEQISSIKNIKFAETLWSIWFGDFSVVDRKALIGELLTNS